MISEGCASASFATFTLQSGVFSGALLSWDSQVFAPVASPPSIEAISDPPFAPAGTIAAGRGFLARFRKLGRTFVTRGETAFEVC